MRTPRPGDLPAVADWQDGRCDCRTRAEHDAVCFTRTREAFRAAFDDDADRLERRVAGALQSPGIRAVVEVVADETRELREERNDSRNAVARVKDLAHVWATVDPDGTMSRRRAAEILRQQVQP